MEPSMTLAAMAAKLFPLLFNMMGPIGVIPAFAALTGEMDPKTRDAVARRAVLLSFCAMIVAVFLGAAMLDAWSIQNGSLILAAGLIVTLTALLPLIPGVAGGGAQAPRAAAVPPLQLALSPLAFPTIVTPRAVGVLVIFVAFFSSTQEKLAVLGVAALMLVLNYFGMRAAAWFMAKVGMAPLLVLGAVFGVLQVALGVEMMVNGWRALAQQ